LLNLPEEAQKLFTNKKAELQDGYNLVYDE
jgi:hypothetical protein